MIQTRKIVNVATLTNEPVVERNTSYINLVERVILASNVQVGRTHGIAFSNAEGIRRVPRTPPPLTCLSRLR
jgi:hypothetical protein